MLTECLVCYNGIKIFRIEGNIDEVLCNSPGIVSVAILFLKSANLSEIDVPFNIIFGQIMWRSY